MSGKRMKHGNSAELSDKNANLYRRPPAMDKADFLSLVDGRDKPEFKPKFAEWLASHCTVNLVRRCFEEQPRQAVEQLRHPRNCCLLGCLDYLQGRKKMRM